MTHFLPLFPLQLVAYPGEKLNLHVFEPRYKQLIREIDHNKTTFGIPAFVNKKIMPIGTELRLLSIEKKYDNGELDIKTVGIGVFKTIEFFSVAPNKLYPGADISRLVLDDAFDKSLNEEILQHVRQLFRHLKIDKKLPKMAANFRMYDIAHYIGLDIKQEYEILAIPTELERQVFALNHLKSLIPMIENMENSRERAQMNGHFKNVIPPKV